MPPAQLSLAQTASAVERGQSERGCRPSIKSSISPEARFRPVAPAPPRLADRVLAQPSGHPLVFTNLAGLNCAASHSFRSRDLSTLVECVDVL